MFNPIYKIRRPLACDKKRFTFQPTPHLLLLGAFNVRVLLTRYGPAWWTWIVRPGLAKYTLLAWLERHGLIQPK